MGDLISPGVQVKEKDLTASVRSEPTSIGATAITATWGPMNEVITINDETQLVDIFGKPGLSLLVGRVFEIFWQVPDRPENRLQTVP